MALNAPRVFIGALPINCSNWYESLRAAKPSADVHETNKTSCGADTQTAPLLHPFFPSLKFSALSGLVMGHPFRALLFGAGTQGVALAFHLAPRWGLGACPRACFEVASGGRVAARPRSGAGARLQVGEVKRRAIPAPHPAGMAVDGWGLSVATPPVAATCASDPGGIKGGPKLHQSSRPLGHPFSGIPSGMRAFLGRGPVVLSLRFSTTGYRLRTLRVRAAIGPRSIPPTFNRRRWAGV